MPWTAAAWALLLGCSEHEVGNFNTAPAASISSPEDGTSFDPFSTIELFGKVSDSQGVAALTVIWSSSIDGELGSPSPDGAGEVYLGVSSLSLGSHVITLSVEDAGLLTASDAITIRIGDGGVDSDGDGYSTETDCDDSDATINPAAEDIPWDGVDQDCDGYDRHDYIALSAGGWFTCGVTTELDLLCWGSDYFGQISGAPDGAFSMVEGGGNHACALKGTGSGACWGIIDGSEGDYGQVTSTTAGPFLDLSAGAAHTCAVDSSSNIDCWGWDSHSQVSGALDGAYAAVSAGSFHTCALTTGGQVQCWGAQDGGTYDAGQVSDAPSESSYTAVGTGYLHSCALSESGSITCWGIADGSSRDEGQVSDTPSDSGYTDLSVGLNHACALDLSGHLVCWGDNIEGQVSGAPDDAGFIAVTAGSLHSCALDAAGEVQCWGDNSAGQSSPPLQ